MKKKFVLGLTSLVVASAVAIGGTLAFMTAQTKEMTNTFTAVGEGLSGIIREPSWDGYSMLDKTLAVDKDQPDGTTPNSAIQDKSGLGLTKASAMTPGMIIPKNPTLGNTSKVPVYMAIKVTYETKAQFDNIATLDLSNDWLEATGPQYSAAGIDNTNTKIYFYTGSSAKVPNQTLLKVSAATQNGANTVPGTTTALFNNVTIKGDGIDVTELKANAFDIKLTGAAVQTTDLSEANTEAANSEVAKVQLINALVKAK